MSTLNYSTFAKLFEEGMLKPNMTGEANSLFKFLIDGPFYAKNSKDDTYIINPRVAREWHNGLTNISPSIVQESLKPKALEYATDNMSNCVEKLLNPVKQELVINNINQVAMSDSKIDESIKTKLSDLLEEGETYEFLAQCFLIAIRANNKILPHTEQQNNRDILSNIDKLKQFINSIPKPLVIDIPGDIKEDEMIYVKALLDAYSDASDIVIDTRECLAKYPKFDEDFKNQRKYYYAAESIRESVRDTLEMSKYNLFEEVKDEVFDGIAEVVSSDYQNGFLKLQETMKHASVLSLGSIIASIPGWIKVEHKKGLCHMLVNDGRIKWVDEDE